MRLPVALALAVAAAWCATVFLPVVSTGPVDLFHGDFFLAEGWIAAIGGQFAWFANPLLIVAIVRVARARRVPWALGALLAACFISALFLRTIPDDSGDRPIRAWYSGYYLWMSLVALGAASPLLRWRRPATAA